MGKIVKYKAMIHQDYTMHISKIWSINNGACDMFHWFSHLLKHELTLMFKYMPRIGCKKKLMQPSFSNKQKKKDYIWNSKIIASTITLFMCSHN